MIFKAVLIFLAVDMGVILFTLFQDNSIWFINTQVAFFSSLIITLGSYFSYQKSINARVETVDSDSEFNDRDEIDKIDDRFDLYSREDESKSEAEIVKEQKSNLKRNLFKNLKYSGSFFSIYRLFGYMALIVAFLILIKNNLFDITSYLFGLFIVPAISMLLPLILRKS